ncbi:hypothetical protein C2E20_9011 [Micractinium conductrix]|uniref:Uncharacterized protein n=1 Tax=Micractinium conductrix TaxID=554055 RepID=A0A2P6UZP7_9CHLO|nr:hypothetical protein C2E20_9011 [Micractinium conductrix]|eukprot:PSC67299.1 hypothetical protein C2E20_9011 [Micractinium conductrix]
MAGAREAPRRPTWLEASPSGARTLSLLAEKAPTDATVRVLEYPPATAARPPTAAASRATPLGAPPTAARPATAAPPGSALTPEPAYSSAALALAAPPTAAATKRAASAVPAALAAPVPTKAVATAAPALPSAGLHGDPALQDRLREHIEQAKAQIRQQLSPMFRLFLPPASCGSSGSHGSRDVFDSPVPASAGSSGRGAAATGVGGAAGLARGGVASPSPLPALPGGAGRKDLDSIVSSIKRLAAEMRLKQGALAAALPAAAAPPYHHHQQHPQQQRSSPVAARLLSPVGSGSSGLPSASGGGHRKPPR